MAIIRKAQLEDLPSLLLILRRFAAETQLPLTFDDEIAHHHILEIIDREDFIFLVEDDGNRLITGIIIGCVSRDFCVETCAYITKMYVEAPLRGWGTSRAMLEEFHEQAKLLGASVVFASSTAGMGDRVEKLYVNLFERYGYTVLGRVLVKEVQSNG